MNISAGKYVKYLFFLSLIMVFAVAADTASAANPIYQIQWQANGIVAELEINGIPLDKVSSEFSGAGSAPLNIWLKPGKNIFTIMLKQFPKAEGSSFKIFLAKAQPGQFSDEGEKVFEFSWESGKSKDKLPLEKKIEFTPEPVATLDLWTKTEQITLDAGTEKDIRAFLKTVSDAYTKADADKVAELQSFKFMDFSRALAGKEMSMTDIKKETKNMLSSLKSDKVKFAPIDIAGAKLRLVGENRLVLVTAKDGSVPLSAKSAKGEYAIDMAIYLARINGKWVVAR